MNAILAGLSGALIAAGILGIIVGLKPSPEPEPRPPWQAGGLRRGWRAMSPVRRWLALAALVLGAVVGVLTSWLILIVVLPAAVLGLPVILATSSDSGRIARLDAIAEWTRNLSGVLVAGQGLEQALMASLRSTPEAIRLEVSRLVARLRSRWDTESALRAFADEVDDATCDLVAAALILGARKRGPGLSAVLTGLAESTADDVRARRQIEADRAKPRATARWVTILSVGALTVLALTGQFLAPYATPLGQLILLALLGCYAAALAWMQRMAATPAPARFLTSRSEVNR